MLTAILYSVCFAFVIVEVLQVHLRVNWNHKPLNCVTCLSGWITLIIGHSFESILWMPVSMVAAILLTNLINKTT